MLKVGSGTCVYVCVCGGRGGGGAEVGLTYLARSFSLRPSYTNDGRSIVK